MHMCTRVCRRGAYTEALRTPGGFLCQVLTNIEFNNVEKAYYLPK